VTVKHQKSVVFQLNVFSCKCFRPKKVLHQNKQSLKGNKKALN